MSERIEGCEVLFGQSEYLDQIPACMNGYWTDGCPQMEVCEVWAKSGGRESVEAIQDNFTQLLRMRTPEQIKKAVNNIADLTLNQALVAAQE